MNETARVNGSLEGGLWERGLILRAMGGARGQ